MRVTTGSGSSEPAIRAAAEKLSGATTATPPPMIVKPSTATGHGTAVAITVGVMLAAAAVLLVVRRGSMEGAPGGVAVGAAVAGALALVVASIPFIANRRIGILGVGLVNDDMAYHLLIADWLNTRVGDMPA